MGKHWDTKDASGVPVEIKELFDGLRKDLADMRAKNEALEREVKKKGSGDVVSRDQVDRMTKGLEKAQDDINALFKAKNRTVVQGSPEVVALETKADEVFANDFLGGADASTVTAQRRIYAKAFSRLERFGESKLSDVEKKALSVGDGPGGGFYVEPARSDRIIQRVFETSDMRSIASVMTIGSNAVILPIDRDDQDVDEVGEQTTRAETETWRVGELEIRVHEMHAQTRITNNMLDDSAINIEEWNNNKIAGRMGRKENSWFVVGNGTKQARGFLTAPTATTGDATRAFGALQFIGTGTSGAFPATDAADKLLDLIYAFKTDYRRNLRWAMNRTILGTIRKFKDGQGNYIAGPRLDKDKGIIDMVFEYPVSEFADMPVAAANALAVALGDWKQGYMIVDRQGLRQLRDPFTRKGSVIFDTTKRVGGDIIDSDAIKLLKLA